MWHPMCRDYRQRIVLPVVPIRHWSAAKVASPDSPSAPVGGVRETVAGRGSAGGTTVIGGPGAYVDRVAGIVAVGIRKEDVGGTDGGSSVADFGRVAGAARCSADRALGRDRITGCRAAVAVGGVPVVADLAAFHDAVPAARGGEHHLDVASARLGVRAGLFDVRGVRQQRGFEFGLRQQREAVRSGGGGA